MRRHPAAPRPARALLAALVAVAAAASALASAGCEQVLGTDFGSYKSTGGTSGGGCSPFVATSCTGGLSCIWDTTAKKFTCDTYNGTRGEDNSCSAEKDCEAGHTCGHTDPWIANHCLRYCQTSDDCEQGRPCLAFNPPRAIDATHNAGACGPLDPACNPLATPAGCFTGERCALLDSEYTICTNQNGTGGTGDTCQFINDCKETLTCDQSTCRPYCDTTAPQCPNGTTCKAFTPNLTWMNAAFGVCK